MKSSQLIAISIKILPVLKEVIKIYRGIVNKPSHETLL